MKIYPRVIGFHRRKDKTVQKSKGRSVIKIPTFLGVISLKQQKDFILNKEQF